MYTLTINLVLHQTVTGRPPTRNKPHPNPPPGFMLKHANYACKTYSMQCHPGVLSPPGFQLVHRIFTSYKVQCQQQRTKPTIQHVPSTPCHVPAYQQKCVHPQMTSRFSFTARKILANVQRPSEQPPPNMLLCTIDVNL